MPKKLKISDVGSDYCLTVRELNGFLTQQGDPSMNTTPVLLKCGGRNYRLAKFSIVAGKSVLVGQRTRRET
jgi:hypothetical protein